MGCIFRELGITFFYQIMVVEKNKFSSNAWHNFAKGKVISKCKNDEPCAILPLFLRRPAPAPYFHPLFSIFQTPSPPPDCGRYLKFTSPPPFKKKGGPKLWHSDICSFKLFWQNADIGGLVVWYLKRWPGFDSPPGLMLSVVNSF